MKEDFENPSQSPIFRELANLSPDVQQLASTLKDFCARTAIDQLESLEAILPKSDANSHSNRGFFYLNNEQYKEALTEFEKAIALDSGYERRNSVLGMFIYVLSSTDRQFTRFSKQYGKILTIKKRIMG